MFRELGVSRALLLQGPMGPFFERLRREMLQEGLQVSKVNFNCGDDWYYRDPDHRLRAPLSDWRQQLITLLEDRQIDGIFLFGDGRPHHRIAVEVAKERGVPLWVFEEGYLRPGYITLERGGVNGHSAMPRDPEYFRRGFEKLPRRPEAKALPNSFALAGWYSTVYSIAITLGAAFYPHYKHHRPLNAFAEAFRWVRGGARRLWYELREKPVLELAQGELSGRYFFVPLQVHCDYQLQHSPYESVADFITQVCESFTEHADAGAHLIIKHHPLDRAYRDYTAFLRRLTARLGISERVHYVHDLHLPSLLRNALGTVTINSTVGLSSLHHGTPVKVMGTALYDIDGMTCQVPLEEFWHSRSEPDQQLYKCFRRVVCWTTQANGNFYLPSPSADTPTGVNWHKLANGGGVLDLDD